jgi:malic enzyme
MPIEVDTHNPDEIIKVCQLLEPMASRPIVFAMANPVPEITYPEAKACRE